MGNPPPYAPPSQEPLQQETTPQKEHVKHVQQFVKLNPQGFVHQQQPYQPQTTEFSDISGGYGYNQQMPPGQMTSTQSTVIVRTKIKFLKRNPGGYRNMAMSPQLIL